MENGKIKAWLPAIQAGSGADVYTRRLAAALERNGITAQISWFPLSHELLPLLLRRTLPPSGTDIIIANSWNAFAFRYSGLPLVAVVHHCVFDPGLRPYKSALQYLYHRFLAEPREGKSLRAAGAVVAVSQCVANHFWQRLGRDDVKVIYNWVDTDLFRPKQPDVGEGKPFRLLFVGKLTRLKGGDMLAPLMRRLGMSFELRFTADPHDCRNMNLPPNMLPIGRFSEQEMVGAYQECDALLLPSRTEGFGYAALEAMACGKPVIASNNTALPELVKDGVTGILCNTGDIEAFANACRRLSKGASLCLKMGDAGRMRAKAQFTEQAALHLYLHLIERFVNVGEKG